MIIKVLAENNTLPNRFFKGEPGLSMFIEDGSTKVLFDVGYSDLFIENARKMSINLYDTNYVVLSNGKFNHTWGLFGLTKYFTEGLVEDINYKKPSLVTHPDALKAKLHPAYIEIGSLFKEDDLKKHFDLKLTRKSFMLTDKLIYLGEIPREYEFEVFKPVTKKVTKDGETEDTQLDDSALVYKGEKGLVIITGSSNSGICNIIDYARLVCEDDRILAIIGGFNLLNPSENRIRETLRFLKTLKPQRIYPCYNTDLKSKIALSSVVATREVGVGLKLDY